MNADNRAGETASRTDAPTEVVLVTAPLCHLCDHAKEILAELATPHRLRIREVEMASPEGREIVRRYRAPFPPVVVIDGVLFGHGRVSRRKLEAKLDRGKTDR